MRFLANENFPLKSIRLLRENGFDVIAVSEEMAGSKDRAILELAEQDHLIILTFDRDYGELIFRYQMPSPAGIIYLRFDPSSPEESANLIIHLLESRIIDFEHKFTVLDRDRIRQRSLP
jgi:predicted nuclease of predicted toxin-antitoxin system